MTKKNKILILFLYLLIVLIFLICFKYKIPCVFKKIFKIPCPACGMTRAFRSIIRLDFYSAFKYNILSIPIFILLITILILDIIDLVFKKNYITKLFNIIKKNYLIIIILLIISWIVNLLK